MSQSSSTINPVTNHSYAFGLATLAGADAIKNVTDTGYGCGSSFITVKYGTPFFRWAKQNGLVKRDAYYGWILDVNRRVHVSGTLESETYNNAFAKSLNTNNDTIHAFVHTYLT